MRTGSTSGEYGEGTFNYNHYTIEELIRLEGESREHFLAGSFLRQKFLESLSDGEVLDSTWSQYSYEEILQMEAEGVVIPEDILAQAHAAQAEDTASLQAQTDESIQDEDINGTASDENNDDTTKRGASFFELVGKASGQIKTSEKKQDEIQDAIDELTPQVKKLTGQTEDFKKFRENALERLKDIVDEWKDLKRKVDRGEKLTPSEGERYQELSAMFDKENDSLQSNSGTAKSEMRHIENSLREIDELARQGEDIGEETMDVGNDLKSYITKPSVKNGFKMFLNPFGLYGSLVFMLIAGSIAKEAIKKGGDIEDFSEDTLITANQIATLLDIEKPLSEPKNDDTQAEAQAEQVEGETGSVDETTADVAEQDGDEQVITQATDTLDGALTGMPTVTSAGTGDVTPETPSGGTSSGSNSETAGDEGGLSTSSSSFRLYGSSVASSGGTSGGASNSSDSDDTGMNIDKNNAKSEGKKASSEMGDMINDTNKAAQETKETTRDEEKSEKELDKETKKLDKEIKKDTKEIEKIAKEGEKTEKELIKLQARNEELNAENEELINATLTEQQKQQGQTPQVQPDNLASSSASVVLNANGNSQEKIDQNISQIDINSAELNVNNAKFKIFSRKLSKGQAKVKSLSKNIKTQTKKMDKKARTRDKIARDRQKAEEKKQAKMQKQLGIVGIFENVFSIVSAIGSILSCFPLTAPAGQVLLWIGLAGTLKCGIEKCAIYAANGYMQQAFVALGMSIVTAAASAVSLGAAGGVANAASKAAQMTLKQVIATCTSAALSTVSASTGMVNNVRQTQGKEAIGALNIVSSTAGALAAATNLSSFKSGNAFEKIGSIASTAGALVSSTSSAISEFGGEKQQKSAQILGLIGTGLSVAGSAFSMGGGMKAKNDAAKNKMVQAENIKMSQDLKTLKDATPELKFQQKDMLAEIGKTLNSRTQPLQAIPSKTGSNPQTTTPTTTQTTSPTTTQTTNQTTAPKSDDNQTTKQEAEIAKAEETAETGSGSNTLTDPRAAELQAKADAIQKEAPVAEDKLSLDLQQNDLEAQDNINQQELDRIKSTENDNHQQQNSKSREQKLAEEAAKRKNDLSIKDEDVDTEEIPEFKEVVDKKDNGGKSKWEKGLEIAGEALGLGAQISTIAASKKQKEEPKKIKQINYHWDRIRYIQRANQRYLMGVRRWTSGGGSSASKLIAKKYPKKKLA